MAEGASDFPQVLVVYRVIRAERGPPDGCCLCCEGYSGYRGNWVSDAGAKLYRQAEETSTMYTAYTVSVLLYSL